MKYISLLIISLFILSCSAEKKAAKKEAKALLPYLTVVNDIDTSYAKKKKAYASIFCGINFPIEVKKERYDSIVYKPIKVIDNTKVNQLRKELERLKLSMPNVNTDSLYQAFYDSVLNDLPECKGYEHYQKSEDTKKDTIGNYHRQQNEDELRNHSNILEAENTSLNKHIEDITKDLNQAHKDKNKWRLYFFLLLGAGIIYKVAKIYLSKSFTLPKIF